MPCVYTLSQGCDIALFKVAKYPLLLLGQKIAILAVRYYKRKCCDSRAIRYYQRAIVSKPISIYGYFFREISIKYNRFLLEGIKDDLRQYERGGGWGGSGARIFAPTGMFCNFDS